MATILPFSTEGTPSGVPEITEIHYDVWSLRVTLDFDGMDGVVYVDFQLPKGFRVLDEDDLREMWKHKATKKHWLLLIEEGGWLTHEAQRADFNSEPADYVEYLLVGSNDCVNVMTVEDPVVTVINTE